MTGAPTRIGLAVLGDSIAAGQGASDPQDALAPRLARGLAAHGHVVTTTVHAVPGARSADLGRQVDRALDAPPDVALVVIGANDLTHLVPAAAAAGDLRDAVRRLRAAGSEVVVAPAPDLSSVPWVPPAMRDAVRAASQALRTAQGEAVRAAGGRLADRDGLSTTSFARDIKLFSADRFHPSSAGYAAIAGALLPDVLDAVRAVATRLP